MGLNGHILTIPRRMTGQTIKTAHLFNAGHDVGRLVGAASVDSSRHLFTEKFDTYNATAVADKWYARTGATYPGILSADTTNYAMQDTAIKMTLTAAGASGHGVAGIKYSASPFFTLDNLRKQLHIRFRRNSTTPVDATVACEVYLGIAHSSGIPTNDNYVLYRFTTTNYQAHGVGWCEVTWNMARDAITVGANTPIDGSFPCILLFIKLVQSGATALTLDWSFDSMWITDEQTLGADNGCVVLMLDDVFAAVGANPHAVGLAKIAESYGQRIVFPLSVPYIGGVEPTGGTVVSWEEIARMSRAGHEFILHDDLDVTGWSEQQNYDRFRTMLDEWYQKAPRYGVQNYQRGMRFCFAKGNHTTPEYVAAAERLGMRNVSVLHQGTVQSTKDNCWPRVDHYLNRWELGAGDWGAGQEFRTIVEAAKAYGAVVIPYSHYCYVEGGTHPDVSDWNDDLAYFSGLGVRFVTLSELYDQILPNELTWT